MSSVIFFVLSEFSIPMRDKAVSTRLFCEFYSLLHDPFDVENS